ncbi:MAG: ABC-type transporter, periplasmic subunit [Gemmatimonadetes bacterium]|nr:ABC-type transporter, periplasmic subunit [Gemmatimonadota bacterium]
MKIGGGFVPSTIPSIVASTARHVLVALVAFSGVAASAACGASPRDADTVVFASGTDLEGANPLATIHPLSRQVQRFLLFTTLVRWDSTLSEQPYLARRWDWSTDRTTLTLHLVSGLAWQDGHVTTARDAAFTLLAARDPATGYARASDLASLSAATATDDSTLVLEWSVPQPALPPILCELPILPEHLLGRTPHVELKRSDFNRAPVGNGPWRFVRRDAGQRWIFERNPEFPMELGGPPAMRRMVVAVVDEPTTKFAGLASGELDFAGISPMSASLAARDPSLRVVDYPVLISTALIFNTQRAPFDDVRLRRAVAASIDRSRIISAALAGYGTVAGGPVPPENPLALRDSLVRNTVLADSLLDAAGWPRGTDGIRMRAGKPLAIELLAVVSGDNAVEQLVQADLRDRGITLAVQPVEMGAFLARARATHKNFDLLITGIPGDLSLSYLGAMFASAQRGGALDYAGHHTPRLDSLLARTHQAPSRQGLVAAWGDVQRELLATVPATWLYHSRGLQGIAARMQHVRLDLRGELATSSRWTVSR